MRKGKFIVIEGSDGSGKGTQFKLIAQKLIDAGYEIATYDFPQYKGESSYFVREYLNGHYGRADDLGPRMPSLFYALDRFEASRSIRENLNSGKIVLSNRFTGSNMAHQGQKLESLAERKKYYSWIRDLEFDTLHIPKPDLNIVITVPAEIAQKLVDKKAARSYTDKKRDIHEADIDHLTRAVATYEQLCKIYPKEFVQVNAARNNRILSIPAITQLIWEKIEKVVEK